MRCLKGALAALVFVAGPLCGGEGAVRVSPGARVLPDQFIVVLSDDAADPQGDPARSGPSVSEVAADLGELYGGRVSHVYEAALKGFAVRMPKDEAERLAADPRVRFVEQDSEAWPAVTQVDPPWGLDRIDQRDLPLSASYAYSTLANNVHVFVIDSGIRPTHVRFGSRVTGGVFYPLDGQGTKDCHGHGTFVAGIVGGTTHGVAKGVRLHPVRVFGCSGGASLSVITAAVDWVTAHRQFPGVVVMGLSASPSSALDAAINTSIGTGLTYVVSAGNSNGNACNFSPARVPAAITVGATTSTDAKWPSSNFGTCVDLFAPGATITSLSAFSDTGRNTMSGTSAAAAHAAGVAALYLATHEEASAAQVRNALVNSSTMDRISNPGSGSANRLLWSLVP